MEFQPKDGGEAWTALLTRSEGSGYDIVLMLDKVNFTRHSGWMLELGINADGTVAGQITAHPGYDALAVFTCTQDTLKVYEDSIVPSCVITDAEGCEQISVARKLEMAVDELRNIYQGSSPVASYTARIALERIGVPLLP